MGETLAELHADQLLYEIDQLVSDARDQGRHEVARLLRKARDQAAKEGHDAISD